MSRVDTGWHHATDYYRQTALPSEHPTCADNGPVDGGTLTFLTLQDQLQHLDPQRNYTGEDLAFANG